LIDGYSYLLECNLRTFKRWINAFKDFDKHEQFLSSYHNGTNKQLIKIMQERVKVLS